MSCNNWREIKVSDAIEFNPRLTLKKGTLAKKVSMKDLIEFNRKIQSYEITEFTSGTKFQNGDTLLARITPCLENGKTAYVDILEEGEVAFGSTEFIVLRSKPGITDDKFVYYLSISPDFRNVAIKSMTGSSGRQRVQNSVLANTTIKIPLLDEQKRIANILSILDEKIELNNELNKALEEIAQSIFKHWFVDFEFPNENGEPYKSSGGKFVESELGMIPEGWKVKGFLEVVNVLSGGTPKTRELSYWNGNIPFFTPKDYNNGFYVLETEKSITDLGLENCNSKLFPINTVFITARGTVGKVCMNAYPMAMNQSCYALQSNDELTQYYLFLLTKRIANNLSKYASGSVFDAITVSTFKSIKIVLPSKRILMLAESIFQSIFELIRNNSIEIKELANLRDTLLPKLMSGEIRVPEADEAVESCLQKNS